ncbi:hypothetical protein FQN60_017496, partial [Etheostoma spectabile]
MASNLRRLSRELPPDLSELLDKLKKHAASFFREFDSSEPKIKEIVKKFEGIADEVRKMQRRTDAVRRAGSGVLEVSALGLLASGAAVAAGAAVPAAVAAGTAVAAAGAAARAVVAAVRAAPARAAAAGAAVVAGTAAAVAIAAAAGAAGAAVVAAVGTIGAVIAAGSAILVAGANVRKGISESGSVNTVKGLLKDFMMIVEPLKKDLEEIKRTCEKLEQRSAAKLQAEKTLTDMLGFQILTVVSILGSSEGVLSAMRKVFRLTATPEEDRELPDSISQSADRCQEVVEKKVRCAFQTRYPPVPGTCWLSMRQIKVTSNSSELHQNFIRTSSTAEITRRYVRHLEVYTMLLSQRRTRCRELTGPTPHSVAVRAKFPSRRPADHLILDRQKQDVAREEVQSFARHQQSSDRKTTWLQTSERRFLRGTIERQVRAALDQQEVHLDQRRDRDQCEELRAVQSRRREQEVCVEREAQVETRLQQQQLQQQEDQLFAELWEADRRAKDLKAAQDTQQRQDRNLETRDAIRTQMEAAEQQRRRHKELREEEAALMLQQQQMQQLQLQREHQLSLQQQQQRRRQLDQGLRLKMKRLAREQQDQLQLDMSILQTLLQQDTDQRQEAAHRK